MPVPNILFMGLRMVVPFFFLFYKEVGSDFMDMPLDLKGQAQYMKQFVHFTQNGKMVQFLSYAGFFRATQYGKFLSNASLTKPSQEALFQLYTFDTNLRQMFFQYTKKVEIQFKSHIGSGVYFKTNDPLFYLDELSYTPSRGESDKRKKEKNRAAFERNFIKNIVRLERELRLDPAKHPELRQFRTKGYRTTPTIPIWAFLDCCELGSTIHIYAYLRGDLRKEILKHGYSRKNYGKETTKQVDTWLQGLRHLRNSSAHHNRLVGRTSSIILPEVSERHILSAQTDLFSRLYALKKLLNTRDGIQLEKDLATLIKRTKLDIYELKILPENWQQRYQDISPL